MNGHTGVDETDGLLIYRLMSLSGPALPDSSSCATTRLAGGIVDIPAQHDATIVQQTRENIVGNASALTADNVAWETKLMKVLPPKAVLLYAKTDDTLVLRSPAAMYTFNKI